ncbi:MAG: hypothetical protein HUJ74_03930 [Lachnospiraceae bacterium]|nr:hypothetical protein [Lachnospiraceae bacterium]
MKGWWIVLMMLSHPAIENAIVSGSFRNNSLIIVTCNMKTVEDIASGYSGD